MPTPIAEDTNKAAKPAMPAVQVRVRREGSGFETDQNRRWLVGGPNTTQRSFRVLELLFAEVFFDRGSPTLIHMNVNTSFFKVTF